MSIKFSQKGKIWIYPGVSGWHFLNIDKNVSEKIRKAGKPYGAGFIRVRATIGKTSWETALFSQKITGTFLLPLKAKIRKTEELLAGDDIKVVLE